MVPTKYNTHAVDTSADLINVEKIMKGSQYAKYNFFHVIVQHQINILFIYPNTFDMNMLPQRWMKKDIGAEVCRHFLDHGNAVIAMAHNRTNNLVG